MMEQQILEFLKDTSKTSLEICSEFGLTIVDMRKVMDELLRKGQVWRRDGRTMGKRKVSRWGLVE